MKSRIRYMMVTGFDGVAQECTLLELRGFTVISIVAIDQFLPKLCIFYREPMPETPKS